MTRINVVPVEELTDNFILAEYFELPRMWPLIYKAVSRNDRDIPDTYRLGPGHLRFFYNKCLYLDNRHADLWEEGMKRGLDLKKDPKIDIWFDDVKDLIETSKLFDEHANFWYEIYTPEPEDIQLNRDRLQFRRKYDGGSYSV